MRQVLITQCLVCEKLFSYVFIINALFGCILHLIKEVVLFCVLFFFNELRTRFSKGQRYRTGEHNREGSESLPGTGMSVGGLAELNRG